MQYLAVLFVHKPFLWPLHAAGRMQPAALPLALQQPSIAHIACIAYWPPHAAGRHMPPAALPLALWQPSISRMLPAALSLAF